MNERALQTMDSEGEDPQWYKDAIIYQVHIRSFMDSNADGIGDFRGLTERLDYIQDLGVTAVWVLPFFPSPLRDDGYDIADYNDVNPMYGTMRDVRRFIREAHARGLKVITEMVANHTSDQHAWFQRARRAKPGTNLRDFYVWSDTADRYGETRIIFKDTETSNWTWDPVADAYFWHRFYHHQPDLNFDNPRVHDAVIRAIVFWFDAGVDGLRLDAIPYLYEREGTNCESLPETHQFLKKLRAHIDATFENRMLLAEANQWPEDAVEYFGEGEGDECHMAFHFPVMPRLYMALRMEDHYPIIDIMEQTPPIPETSQWAMFLRNHDELTLEMVTDEERDYMYRVYAYDPDARINLGIRRRLAPLMNNNRRRIELMNGLLFSLPGTPVIYYGDEIGMGDNIYLGDRNGVRTPMQWTADRNAGFSDANRQKLYSPVIVDPEYHYETINVETQQRNPQSLLWWMKRLIDLRKRYRAFGRGTLAFLPVENRKILAFVREYEDEKILVVANLSRFTQAAELDLSAYQTMVPVEMFGRTHFPPIGELPYFVTLAPHSFYWFSIEPQEVRGEYEPAVPGEERSVPALSTRGEWESLLGLPRRQRFIDALTRYVQERRWYRSKARTIRQASIRASVPIPLADAPIQGDVQVVLFDLDFSEGEPETYLLPLAFATGERAFQVSDWTPHAIVARLTAAGEEGVLYDALWEPEFTSALLDIIGRQRSARGEAGRLRGVAGRSFRRLRGTGELSSQVSTAEQSNSAVVFGNRLILKLFRKVEEDVNPDYEIGRFLTERTSFQALAPVAGALNFEPGSGGAPMTAGILLGFVENEGDAWTYTLDVLGSYVERLLTEPELAENAPEPPGRPLDVAATEIPEEAFALVGPYLDEVRTLGQRTAEMHLALASRDDDPAFRPEDFSLLGQRALYQSMRSQSRRILRDMRRWLSLLPEDVREEAADLIEREAEVLERYQGLIDHRIDAQSTRTHGDYHLGQVLYTGRDFVIIDFEGEPARPIGERRLKRSPLRDVAGMLRSFDYAAHSGLHGRGAWVREEDAERVAGWVRVWYRWVSGAFLRGYFEVAGEAEFLPSDPADLQLLLDAYVLEKAIYEIGYEMNNRPDWVTIPLRGIIDLVEQP
jgi:maltose alpha-D-glucosyltransferase/alpha-amylase